MTRQSFSLWYLPTAETGQALRAWIDRLAVRFGVDAFAPHVTGFSGEFEDRDAWCAQLKQVLRNLSPFTLKTMGFGYSERYHQTFFIKLAAVPLMEAVRHGLWEATGRTSSYHLFPHLSLLYADLPLQEKRALAETESLPYTELRFDRAQLVHPRDPELGWHNIADLEILGEETLG